MRVKLSKSQAITLMCLTVGGFNTDNAKEVIDNLMSQGFSTRAITAITTKFGCKLYIRPQGAITLYTLSGYGNSMGSGCPSDILDVLRLLGTAMLETGETYYRVVHRIPNCVERIPSKTTTHTYSFFGGRCDYIPESARKCA